MKTRKLNERNTWPTQTETEPCAQAQSKQEIIETSQTETDRSDQAFWEISAELPPPHPFFSMSTFSPAVHVSASSETACVSQTVLLFNGT